MFDYSINKYLDFFCEITKIVYFCKNNVMKKIIIVIFSLFVCNSSFSQELPPSIKYGKLYANKQIKIELDSLSKLYSVNVIKHNVIETKDSIFSEITYGDQYGIVLKKLFSAARKLSVPVSCANHTNSIKLK